MFCFNVRNSNCILNSLRKVEDGFLEVLCATTTSIERVNRIELGSDLFRGSTASCYEEYIEESNKGKNRIFLINSCAPVK